MKPFDIPGLLVLLALALPYLLQAETTPGNLETFVPSPAEAAKLADDLGRPKGMDQSLELIEDVVIGSEDYRKGKAGLDRSDRPAPRLTAKALARLPSLRIELHTGLFAAPKEGQGSLSAQEGMYALALYNEFLKTEKFYNAKEGPRYRFVPRIAIHEPALQGLVDILGKSKGEPAPIRIQAGSSSCAHPYQQIPLELKASQPYPQVMLDRGYRPDKAREGSNLILCVWNKGLLDATKQDRAKAAEALCESLGLVMLIDVIPVRFPYSVRWRNRGKSRTLFGAQASPECDEAVAAEILDEGDRAVPHAQSPAAPARHR